MTKFVDSSGILLTFKAEALVNTVNTVGVMGKGIALQFKRAFPANFTAYKRACSNNQVELGQMFVTGQGAFDVPRWIINFPTKDHWRSRSKLEDVATGLVDLRSTIEELQIKSIALPPLGCGLGGLSWRDVEPLIRESLDDLDTTVHLFAPTGAPAAAQQKTEESKPDLTRSTAILLETIRRYSTIAFDVSQIEIQKLLYFLQEGGQNLNLNYQKDLYGPYADGIRPMLRRLEGHYLVGYGDGSTTVHNTEPIRLLDGAREDAAEVLADDAGISERLDHLLQLADWFESAYGLELLATVHWCITHNDTDETNQLAVAHSCVASWNERKKSLFTRDHIKTAVEHLTEHRMISATRISA